MIPDDDLVMISALQHYLFCPRQCALIHAEAQWSDNYLTAAGKALHARVDSFAHESRHDIHVATTLRLASHTLGLTGVADLVEFHRVEGACDAAGVKRAAQLPGHAGWWRPLPVEYKHGRPKARQADEVQLCAQAICLEEMLGVTIDRGALFYGETRRRTEVVFDGALRNLVKTTVESVREIVRSGISPAPAETKGCEACSMKDLCRPEKMQPRDSVRRWIQNRIEELTAS